MDFDLNKFLKKYKPKTIDITPYLRFSVLKDYNIMNDNKKLIPTETYIKYIKEGNAYENKKYSSKAIEDGGLLIAGGIFVEGKFVENNDRDSWTHLKLDSNVSKKTGEKQKFYYYYIKIMTHYIFYKYVKNGNNFMYLLENV